ncbi:class I SAM-dependent methyltransferase [Aquicoccus porphyridii]|uniref:Class I SAM-dependent methyltransferase n=1 Tax=Aquicoccus porphyridii TaxID=1852029 RepID=A0A5A9ZSG3_9RHOB|nr:cyclopropane-fatty-acyl-phospholipid synthase family protein [Aquicoccus porphyridii]KAA0920243.1 class I SAM-dependent methyltransferase [Aquicoccus porphyridii]RAI54959.1 class I SAM-dependent methyltransferase [Rhodobacteraceae bacterium AsT-22]
MLFVTKRVRHEFLESCSRIRRGSLHLVTPEGERHDFGSGAPQAVMELHDWSVVTAMAVRGDIGLGEAYVAGLWDTPSIETLASVATLNLEELSRFAYPGFWSGLKFRAVDRILRANSQRGAPRNIRAHYDVGNEFYQLWLDEGMTYSSAMFAPGDNDLERAQTRKYDRALSRMSDGERILEIGCGWGGFAERAAGQGRDVTGITISPSQKGFADARLDGRARIELRDYRKTEGTFDNIVSIEMIEAVGERYWPSYFSTLKARLAEGGRAVVQAITVPDEYFPRYRKGTDYIRHYTFPGGMLLSDRVISQQARRAGLVVRDSVAFGEDYARTCRTWAERLVAASPRIEALGYDRAFLRNWQYYLEICASSFALAQTDVVQVELEHA